MRFLIDFSVIQTIFFPICTLISFSIQISFLFYLLINFFQWTKRSCENWFYLNPSGRIYKISFLLVFIIYFFSLLDSLGSLHALVFCLFVLYGNKYVNNVFWYAYYFSENYSLYNLNLIENALTVKRLKYPVFYYLP